MNDLKLKDLVPNAKNPRKIREKKREMLKKALEEFGDLGGIVYNLYTKQIVGGHQRRDAMSEAQITITQTYEAPTRTGTIAEGYAVIDGERFAYREVAWPLEKEKAANIAANNGAGEWDLPQLSEWLLDLDSLNFDLDLTLFDEKERENLIVPIEKVPPAGDPDHVPGSNKDIIAKRGDIWKMGEHYLMCGDSTVITEMETLMAGAKARMVFTDPPYNIDYKGGSKAREKIENDSMSGEDFYQFLLAIYSNLNICMEPGASIYVCHADTERVNFTKAFQDASFHLSSVIIWAKNNATFGRQDYFWKHEPILYGWNSSGAHKWHGPNNEETIWSINRPAKSDDHPTMKPIELVERAIRNSTKPKEIILDCFSGSGSTLIACEKTDRVCYAMELDPKYVDVAVRRWMEYTGKIAYRILEDGTEEAFNVKI